MPKTILLVDDDVDYLTSVRLQLEAAGFEVATAESAAQARAWLGAHQPALAVVDLMMEHADAGFGLCHFLRQSQPQVPIVMVTGVAAETGLDFGTHTRTEKSWLKADALLNKPVRFEQLQREIQRLVKD
jgi:CheY-like chemotaxis protein